MNKGVIESSTPSYSMAFYVSAQMEVDKGNYKKALEYLDKGLELEPDHPSLYCEKAYIMQEMKQYDEAYSLYYKATNVRPWATADKARAIRGMGYILTEKWLVGRS